MPIWLALAICGAVEFSPQDYTAMSAGLARAGQVFHLQERGFRPEAVTLWALGEKRRVQVSGRSSAGKGTVFLDLATGLVDAVFSPPPTGLEGVKVTATWLSTAMEAGRHVASTLIPGWRDDEWPVGLVFSRVDNPDPSVFHVGWFRACGSFRTGANVGVDLTARRLEPLQWAGGLSDMTSASSPRVGLAAAVATAWETATKAGSWSRTLDDADLSLASTFAWDTVGPFWNVALSGGPGRGREYGVSAVTGEPATLVAMKNEGQIPWDELATKPWPPPADAPEPKSLPAAGEMHPPVPTIQDAPAPEAPRGTPEQAVRDVAARLGVRFEPADHHDGEAPDGRQYAEFAGAISAGQAKEPVTIWAASSGGYVMRMVWPDRIKSLDAIIEAARQQNRAVHPELRLGDPTFGKLTEKALASARTVCPQLDRADLALMEWRYPTTAARFEGLWYGAKDFWWSGTWVRVQLDAAQMRPVFVDCYLGTPLTVPVDVGLARALGLAWDGVEGHGTIPGGPERAELYLSYAGAQGRPTWVVDERSLTGGCIRVLVDGHSGEVTSDWVSKDTYIRYPRLPATWD